MELLRKFAERFTWETKIPVFLYEQEFSWCRIFFTDLNCEELESVAQFIRNRFTEPGNYAHCSPKLGCKGRLLTLTVDVKQLQKAMDKLPYFEKKFVS